MKHLYLLTLFALTLCFAGTVTAQEAQAKEPTQKVVVITKKADKDGNVTVEKFVTVDGKTEVFSGVDAESIERIDVFKGNNYGDVDVEVDVDGDGNSTVVVVRTGDETETIRVLGDTDVSENVAVFIGDDGDQPIIVENGEMELMADEIHYAVASAAASDVNCVALGVYVNSSRAGGARVSGLISGGGAQDAGMDSHDLIKRIDDYGVSNVSELHNALAQYQPGDVVKVTFDRDGSIMTADAELRAWRDLDGYENSWRSKFDCGDDPDEVRDEWNEERHRPHSNCVALGVFVSTSRDGGALISSTIDGGGAEAAGLESHDLIKAIDDYEVNSVAEMHEALGNYRPGDIVRVEVERDGERDAFEVDLRAWGELPDYKDSWRAKVTCGDENYQETFNFLETEEEVTRTVTIVKKDAEEEEAADYNVSPLEDLQKFDYTLDLDNFTVFPNPTSGRFNVQFEAEAKPLTVTIYDNTGREIFRDNQTDFNGMYNREIDLTNIARGSIILSVAQDGKRYTDQIILQ